jgi:hypothetical protein
MESKLVHPGINGYAVGALDVNSSQMDFLPRSKNSKPSLNINASQD